MTFCFEYLIVVAREGWVESKQIWRVGFFWSKEAGGVH